MRSKSATDLISVIRPANFSTNKIPVGITADEFKEITESPELQEMWGAEDAEELTGILANDYIVKFAYKEPEYTGDLFIIQSDKLDREILAIQLVRGRWGKLVVLR